MSPSLATFATLGFVLTLYMWDVRRTRRAPLALWLPVAWILITGSRFPSQWIRLGDPAAVLNVADGSSLDAAFFSTLIVMGLVVLFRRQINVERLVRRNVWLVALLLFGLMSLLWSDFPFVAFKRWIKALGHPVMAMIILTEASPALALRIVMRRCAYFLIPMSILFVKFLPQFGRSFDAWSGEGTFVGVMLTKNDLGYVCVIFGMFFLWDILSGGRAGIKRLDTLLSVVFLVMILWLLDVSSSATSLVTFTIGAAVLIGLSCPLISKRHFVAYFLLFAAVAIGFELTFGVYEKTLGLLGREASLTDRTALWSDVIALQTRPITGMGFESFWLGSRLEWLHAKWWWRPNQAHNGYIETYLNLGVIGLLLLGGLILSTFHRISAKMTSDAGFATLSMALLLAILAHNYTEASFKGVHLMWTMFYLVAIEYGRAGTVQKPSLRKHPASVMSSRMTAKSDVRRHGSASAAAGAGHYQRRLASGRTQRTH